MRPRWILLPLLVATAAATGCNDHQSTNATPADAGSVEVITDAAQIASARKAWAESREQALAALLANPVRIIPQDEESLELLRSQRDRSLKSLASSRDEDGQSAERRIRAVVALQALGVAPDPIPLAKLSERDDAAYHLLWDLPVLYKPKDGLPAPLRQAIVRALRSKEDYVANLAADRAALYRMAEAADPVAERVRTDAKADTSFVLAAAKLRPTGEVLDPILARLCRNNRDDASHLMAAVANVAKASTDPAVRKRAIDACLLHLKREPDGPAIYSGTSDALDAVATLMATDDARFALEDLVRTAPHQYLRQYALDRLKKLDPASAARVAGETNVKSPYPDRKERANRLTLQQVVAICVRHKVVTQAEADAALAALAKPSSKTSDDDDDDSPDHTARALLHAANRFTTFDVETGLSPNRHDRLILDLAVASAGQFKPEAVTEDYVTDHSPRQADSNGVIEVSESDTGKYTVQFIHSGRLYRFNPRDLGDWYDLDAVLAAINRSLGDAGSAGRFVPLESNGQFAELIFADPAVVRAAAAELGLTLSTDPDEGRKQGKAYEKSVMKRLKGQ